MVTCTGTTYGGADVESVTGLPKLGFTRRVECGPTQPSGNRPDQRKRGQIILKVGVDADDGIALSGHVLQAREQGILMADVAGDPHARDATRECAGGFRNLLLRVVA
jgi:hypothetical protein